MVRVSALWASRGMPVLALGARAVLVPTLPPVTLRLAVRAPGRHRRRDANDRGGGSATRQRPARVSRRRSPTLVRWQRRGVWHQCTEAALTVDRTLGTRWYRRLAPARMTRAGEIRDVRPVRSRLRHPDAAHLSPDVRALTGSRQVISWHPPRPAFPSDGPREESELVRVAAPRAFDPIDHPVPVAGLPASTTECQDRTAGRTLHLGTVDPSEETDQLTRVRFHEDPPHRASIAPRLERFRQVRRHEIPTISTPVLRPHRPLRAPIDLPKVP